jgi:glycosyltransferase involved in cell wall biosynthesis
MLTGWVERFAYRNSDACVSLLPGAKSHMVERGLPLNRFHYIPNGASLSAAQLQTDALSTPALNKVRLLRDDGRFVVIYPGAMGPPNNMLPLIEAAHLLSAKIGQAVHFVLMGQGGEIPALKERVRHFGLTTVHFFPQSNRQVALALMSMASAGYVSVRRLPIYRHGISFNKLFEYMQQKLPVIFAADVPGNPVELAGCGVITSPDDPVLIANAIYSLSKKSSSDLASMGQAGRSFVERHHDYTVLAAEYLQLFEHKSS